MKKILYLIYICAGGLLLGACNVTVPEEPSDSPHIEVTLNTSALETKATKEGEDEYNENLVKTIDWFLYTSGSTGKDAVLSGHETGLNAVKNGKFSIYLDEVEINSKVFPHPYESCEIYIIANLPNGTTLPSSTAVDSLKKYVSLSTDFHSFTSGKSGQYSFVMDGQGTVTLSSRTATIVATPTVEMTRIANKVTLAITVAEFFKDKDSVKWTPDPTNVWVKLYNARKNSKLSGDPDDTAEPDYISYPADASVEGKQGISLTWSSSEQAAISIPFYSYPSKWELNSSTEPEIIVMVPWSNGTQTTPFYYKLLLSGTSMEKNVWMHTKAHLSALGSLYETAPKLVTGEISYSVCDWNNTVYSAGNSVDAIFRDARYLVIPRKEYRLDNESTLDIEYSTSHPCEIVLENLVITRQKFSSSTTLGTTAYYTPCTDTVKVTESELSNWFTLYNSGTKSYIRYTHTMKNDVLGTSDYDYSPYTVNFIIRHKDEAGRQNYKDSVTIVQYPAMYIEVEKNSKGYLSGDGDLYGTVFLNAGQAPDPSVGSRNAITDIGGNPYGGQAGSNKNGNMYVITTTAFNSGNYIIADPRKPEVDNLLKDGSNWTYSTTSIQGGSRKLSYYHSTDTLTTNDNNVSPKFRIASSWGVANSMDYDNAFRRCAAYQEDGYPAGRWRVPTKAEVLYLIKLSADGTIPVLFGTLTKDEYAYYWCNSGYIAASRNQSGNQPPIYTHSHYNSDETYSEWMGQSSVRCVYDDWFWENTDYPRLSSYSTFTWGDLDMPIK